MSDGKFWSDQTMEVLVGLGYKGLKKHVPFFFRFLLKPGLLKVLEFINLKVDRAIPDKYDHLANQVVMQFAEKNFEGAMATITQIQNLAINIPGVSEANEQKGFYHLNQAILSFMGDWIAKKELKE